MTSLIPATILAALALTSPPAPTDEPGPADLVWMLASADRVLREGEVYGADEAVGEVLTEIYPQRTFRFCFSNQQMGRAILNHIRNQRDLLPDTDLIHFVSWSDDRYSRDLTDAFSMPSSPGELLISRILGPLLPSSMSTPATSRPIALAAWMATLL